MAATPLRAARARATLAGAPVQAAAAAEDLAAEDLAALDSAALDSAAGDSMLAGKSGLESTMAAAVAINKLALTRWVRSRARVGWCRVQKRSVLRSAVAHAMPSRT